MRTVSSSAVVEKKSEIISTRKSSAAPGPAPVLAKVRALIARDGERAVLEKLGLSRTGLYRALSGLPVGNGVRALLTLGVG